MRGGRFAAGMALALALAAAACQRAPTPASPTQSLLLPDAARIEADLTRIQLRGAGDRRLVSIERVDGQWRMADKAGWPVDPGLIEQLLADVAAARREEAKTARPDLYARLGVEDTATAGATGLRLRLLGGSGPWELIVGKAAGAAGGRYVRVAGEAQAWRIDRDLLLPRDPLDWLDRNLIDRPLAREERVEVTPVPGARFELVRRDDRFVIAGVAVPGQDQARLADALAGGLDQLKLEDVAPDEGKPAVERQLRFRGVDGVDVDIGLWREQGQYWARLSVALDAGRAKAWNGVDGDAESGRELERRVAQWQERFSGRRFRLAPLQASQLMLTRAQILAGRE